jgi:hypothetical protein
VKHPQTQSFLALPLLALLATSPSHADTSISAHAATIGYGMEIGYKFNPDYGIRVGAQKLNRSFKFQPKDENGVSGDELKYNGKINLKNANIFADWYPSKHRFRLTGGLLLNNSTAKFITNCESNSSGINPIPTNCEIGAGSAVGSDIGEITTKITFDNKVAPYLGIGWGYEKDDSWGFSVDLGVAYLGNADADIQSSGSCNTNASCRAQLDEEEKEVEDDLGSLKFFPVAKIGIGLVF